MRLAKVTKQVRTGRLPLLGTVYLEILATDKYRRPGFSPVCFLVGSCDLGIVGDRGLK